MSDHADHQGRADMASKPPVYEFDASSNRFEYAWRDIKDAVSRPRLVLTLVKTTFFNRFQGTVLGGFWITLSTLIVVSGMAVLWGKIFGVSLREYFPYVSIGIIVWGLLSTILNDAAAVFILGTNVFNQIPMPKSIFALKALGVTIIAFLYKIIVIVGVLVIYNRIPDLGAILASLLGLLLTLWTGFWFSLLIGTLGARFRDIGQLTAAFVTFAFFLTPVLWQKDRLGEYAYLVDFNPLFHFLHIIRGPLIGADGVAESFLWAGLISLLTTIGGGLFYGLFARRLCYWS